MLEKNCFQYVRYIQLKQKVGGLLGQNLAVGKLEIKNLLSYFQQ